MRHLGEKELRHIVLGGGLFGAGGGGSVAEGMKLVDRVLEFAPTVALAEPGEIEDESHGVVIAGMGSPKASLTRVRTHSPRIALEMLESSVGFICDYVIPFEMGAGNSLNPMLAAVQRRIPIIDGDPAGRAVPEIGITTFAFGGVSICPLALANEDGIKVTIEAEAVLDVERVARVVTAELQGVSAIACYPMDGRTMKSHIIYGTTTLAEQIGATISRLSEQNGDPSDALVREFDGYLLGRGRVAYVNLETRGGFDFGVVHLEGELPVTVHFQNENLIAYRGNRLVALAPDLICAVSSQGTPLTNADIAKGTELSYLGFKAPNLFRTKQAITGFRRVLDAIDLGVDFMPLENLVD